MVGVSLPNYWLGIVLVIVFAVEYMLLPATGILSLTGSDTPANYQQYLDLVQYSSTSSDPTNGGADTSRTVHWQRQAIPCFSIPSVWPTAACRRPCKYRRQPMIIRRT